MVFVGEPMISFSQVPSWFLPNIWGMWSNNNIPTTFIFASDQCIALEMSCNQTITYIVANHGQSITRVVWWETMSSFITEDIHGTYLVCLINIT